MTPKERARKVVEVMENGPMILPEGVTFSSWVEDMIAKAIEDAEHTVRLAMLEYADAT